MIIFSRFSKLHNVDLIISLGVSWNAAVIAAFRLSIFLADSHIICSSPQWFPGTFLEFFNNFWLIDCGILFPFLWKTGFSFLELLVPHLYCSSTSRSLRITSIFLSERTWIFLGLLESWYHNMQSILFSAENILLYFSSFL